MDAADRPDIADVCWSKGLREVRMRRTPRKHRDRTVRMWCPPGSKRPRSAGEAQRREFCLRARLGERGVADAFGVASIEFAENRVFTAAGCTWAKSLPLVVALLRGGAGRPPGHFWTIGLARFSREGRVPSDRAPPLRAPVCGGLRRCRLRRADLVRSVAAADGLPVPPCAAALVRHARAAARQSKRLAGLGPGSHAARPPHRARPPPRRGCRHRPAPTEPLVVQLLDGHLDAVDRLADLPDLRQHLVLLRRLVHDALPYDLHELARGGAWDVEGFEKCEDLRPR